MGVAQFEGGDTGRELSALLTQRGIRVVAQPVAAPTRVCTTLLSKGEAEGVEVTELVEPGGEVGRGVGGGHLTGGGGGGGEESRMWWWCRQSCVRHMCIT